LKYAAILFDLDGTLLPMDNMAFVQEYFTELAKVMAKNGIDGKAAIKNMWKGIDGMMKNDGVLRNSQVFWREVDEFCKANPRFEEVLENFYANEYCSLSRCVEKSEMPARVVAAAKKASDKLVLATNAVFPMEALVERLSWVGLKAEDFCHITAYDNTGFCKPNPDYYLEIAEKIGVDPRNCLMVGNDVREDVIASRKAGMSGYLVKDFVITHDETLPEGAPEGTLADAEAFLLK